MGELSVNDNNGELIGLMHENNGLSMPKPFEHDILLFDTMVAGTSHVEGIEELEPFLKVGDRLDFFREPDNEYDPKAIAVKNSNGVKIGYVPKNDNVVFSRLMDAGKMLFGKISYKEMQGNWVKIEMQIFLHD
jgi:hypothetical protein